MKSYILLKPEPVQSQMSILATGAKPPTLFNGLDVHNDSIAVSIAPSDSPEARAGWLAARPRRLYLANDITTERKNNLATPPQPHVRKKLEPGWAAVFDLNG